MDDSWQEVRGWRRLWARNMAAARANLVPGLVLQLLPLMVLVSMETIGLIQW